MKLELVNKIKENIEAYQSNSKAQGEAITKMLEVYKVPSYAARFTREGLQAEIKEQMDAIVGDWKKYDLLMNQQMKNIIAKAKQEVMKELGLDRNVSRPSDYAQRISNAIVFVKEAISDIEPYEVAGTMDAKKAAELDTDLHSILKEFVGDYDTMKSFKKMIEKKIPYLCGYDGKTILPKTFCQYVKVESIMNTIDELDATSENIFIHKKTDGQEVFRYNGMSFAIPGDGYAEKADEQNIVDYATILEDLADHIDSVGQGASTESGVVQNPTNRVEDTE